MGKVGIGIKAGALGGVIAGIFLASANYIVTTIYKEAYINMFKRIVEKLSEEYGVTLPYGSPEEAALAMYNLSRIQGSIYAIIITVIMGVIVGAVLAKFYSKLPSGSPLVKALLVSYIILVVKTGLSLTFSGIGGFKSEELGIPQVITTFGYIMDITSYTIMGLAIGALYGKWVTKAEESL